jgi:hypothetical protein
MPAPPHAKSVLATGHSAGQPAWAANSPHLPAPGLSGRRLPMRQTRISRRRAAPAIWRRMPLRPDARPRHRSRPQLARRLLGGETIAQDMPTARRRPRAHAATLGGDRASSDTAEVAAEHVRDLLAAADNARRARQARRAGRPERPTALTQPWRPGTHAEPEQVSATIAADLGPPAIRGLSGSHPHRDSTRLQATTGHSDAPRPIVPAASPPLGPGDPVHRPSRWGRRPAGGHGPGHAGTSASWPIWRLVALTRPGGQSGLMTRNQRRSVLVCLVFRLGRAATCPGGGGRCCLRAGRRDARPPGLRAGRGR